MARGLASAEEYARLRADWGQAELALRRRDRELERLRRAAAEAPRWELEARRLREQVAEFQARP